MVENIWIKMPHKQFWHFRIQWTRRNVTKQFYLVSFSYGRTTSREWLVNKSRKIFDTLVNPFFFSSRKGNAIGAILTNETDGHSAEINLKKSSAEKQNRIIGCFHQCNIGERVCKGRKYSANMGNSMLFVSWRFSSIVRVFQCGEFRKKSLVINLLFDAFAARTNKEFHLWISILSNWARKKLKLHFISIFCLILFFFFIHKIKAFSNFSIHFDWINAWNEIIFRIEFNPDWMKTT